MWQKRRASQMLKKPHIGKQSPILLRCLKRAFCAKIRLYYIKNNLAAFGRLC